MSPERIARLNYLGFSWDAWAEAWETHFAALERFKQREGHCRIPQQHQEDGLSLGVWVATQRTKKDTMSPERITRLNHLGFSWDARAEAWGIHFAALERFKQREGHACPTLKHQEDGLKLGSWVGTQRTTKGTMSPERIARLNHLGFSWNPLTEVWETHFAALQKFRKREGHCRVPARHQEDGLNLGGWVIWQRSNKKKLTPDQLKRLKALCFIWKT